MKRVLSLAIVVASLHAASMQELFRALKKEPWMQSADLALQLSKLNAQSKKDRFYPTIEAFVAAEYYSAPTNLRPISPLESERLARQGKPFPFAKRIERLGIRASMPLFVKSLFDLKKRAAILVASAKAKRRLVLLQNEALLVGLNAQFGSLASFERAIDARIASIKKQRDDAAIAAASGKVPEILIDKLDTSLIALEQSRNDIQRQKVTLQSQIETLTGLTIDRAIPMRKVGSLKKGAFLPLEPLKKEVEARRHALDAAKGALYPSLFLQAKISENYGQGAEVSPLAPTIDEATVHRNYGKIALNVSLPLYDRLRYRTIEMAKAKVAKSHAEFLQAQIALQAEAKAIEKSLTLLDRSASLAQKRIQKRQNLLAYAKVAFEAGRMSEEEYLRYEETLLSAQSELFKLRAQRWQSWARLALIYGNDLASLVH